MGRAGVRAPVANLDAGERRVPRETAHYLTHVLRLRIGDAFRAFDPDAAREAEATIVAIDGAGVIAAFGEVEEAPVAAPRSVTWIHGLAKGDKCDALVRDATELGVTTIAFASTDRSVLKLDAKRGAERKTRWERIAREASRQCGRSDAPRVLGPIPLADALASAERDAARFLLYERATDPLGPRVLAALSTPQPIAFAAGPEGGFSDAEVELAVRAGYAPVSLGRLILRTETVAAAVLGAVRILERF